MRSEEIVSLSSSLSIRKYPVINYKSGMNIILITYLY